MTFVVIAAVGLGVGVTAGIGKMVAGGVQRKKAKLEKQEQQARLEEYKQEYAGLDTSNPYLNMERVFEDQTVSMKEAEFTRQTQQQSQANILEQMRSAAGGSGIGALAQSLASQSSLDAQRASVSIGQQERQLQQQKLQEEANIRDKQIQGEIMSRQAEGTKLQTLMGMKAGEVTAAAEHEQQATQAMYEGMGDIAEAGAAAAGGMGGGMGGVG